MMREIKRLCMVKKLEDVGSHCHLFVIDEKM